LGVDAPLAHGTHNIVDRIADIPNLRKCYSFATKFCSWHNPTGFPLYDGYVDECLWSYKKQAEQEMQLPFAKFRRQDLLNYEKLVVIISAFRSHYKLDSLTFKQLDKFLWRSGFQITQSPKPE
jgi:hypothetical protein